MLLVCHDMDFVAEHASRVLALAGGRLIADLRVAEFFADPVLTRSASVEQPGIVSLSLATLSQVELNAQDFAAQVEARLQKGAR